MALAWWNSSLRSGLLSTALVLLVAAADPAASQDAPSASATSREAAAFMTGGTYDPTVPTPESVLGFPMGSRPVRYEEMRRYFDALAAASPRVSVRSYARSHEGRDLVVAVVGTAARIADLEQVRGAITAWADPLHGPDDPPADLPVVAWLGYAIHGDELSSTDAAVQLLYQLAAGTDPVTSSIRDSVLVCVDPNQNPDGRERYLAQMQAAAGVVPNSDAQSLQHQGFWPWGRANHYLFDLNRDWIFVVNPESRGRVSAIDAWKPQVVVDCHEMGWDETYLFSPPREPFNPHLPRTMRPWAETFAGDQASAFDHRGWNYYTREWNEEFYPGYGSSWAAYAGAVGILYEQAGTDGSLVRQPDGAVLTYRDAVAHQFTSSLANLQTAARNRTRLLRDYRAARRAGVDAGRRGPVRAFAWSSADSSLAAHLATILLAQGVEVYRARGPLTLVDAHDMWGGGRSTIDLPPGSWTVPVDQPLGPLVLNLLEPHVAMPDSFLHEERDWLERGKGSRLYESTAWSLPLGHDVAAYWTGGAPRGDLEEVAAVQPAAGRVEHPHPDFAYVIDGQDDAVVRAVARLLEQGASVRIALEPFTVDGHRFARGSALLRLQSNPDGVHEWVAQAAADAGVVVYGVSSGRARTGPDLGGNRFPVLEPPRVAILTGQPVSFTSYGAIWHLLDHDLHLRVSSLDVQGLRNVDLSKYNVLVMPRARGGGYARILGHAGLEAIRQWVESGGTLVGVGEGAAFAADTTQSLSQVRLRRQVLEDFAPGVDRLPLPEIGVQDAIGDAPHPAPEFGMPLLGPAALQYVRATKPRGVQAALVDQPKKRASKTADANEDKSDKEPKLADLERADERLRLFHPQGAMVRADFDREHWLSAGVHGRAPVFIDSDFAFIARPPVHVVARLATTDSLQLSGLVWPEAAARIARTAYLTQESRGKGQIILFADDPTFRRSMRGIERLFLNAVVFGPGLGTSRPAPW